jgi:hypothetical protein
MGTHRPLNFDLGKMFVITKLTRRVTVVKRPLSFLNIFS